MTKVMLSLSDEVLEKVDAEARQLFGTSERRRSHVVEMILRKYFEREKHEDQVPPRP